MLACRVFLFFERHHQNVEGRVKKGQSLHQLQGGSTICTRNPELAGLFSLCLLVLPRGVPQTRCM